MLYLWSVKKLTHPQVLRKKRKKDNKKVRVTNQFTLTV